MDWSRAKSVLIYAFLLLNVVLGYQLWQDLRDKMHSELDWTSLSAETQLIMNKKQIQVLATIPSETPSLHELTYRITTRKYKTPLKQQEDTKIIFSQKELVRGLDDEIEHMEMYHYDQFSGDDRVFVLHQQMANGLPLFEVKLELYYESQKIKAFSQQYAEPEDSKDAQEQKILPATQALGRVIEILPTNAVVRDVRLGYHGQLFNTDTQVAAPTWRVLLDSGDAYYMNAINGAVEHVPVGKKESKL
ncbi:two-component system regulatory protein YycI [Paenibacillus sp. ACRRX]|uniref:two-component system regulatory protein YycI n=1 Tax=unclassified Paenibacillus TaxID=185978 RepID=UPI001EF55543|nr:MULTISPECIES: two-component system regulatory protein YycI [unclassified Paenibacillus]MCG7408357.1 two-component system regulatory protein YycI [Paenibacillus sp. ACRRX]MDK8181258.1 two-component system regulatory protein YycI [Paenibacillus sp. UMB4589-SE434]